MPIQDFTKELKAQARKLKLKVSEKAFADLRLMGWDDLDAYIASGLYDNARNLPTNIDNIEKLKGTSAFGKYYNEREAEMLGAREEAKAQRKAARERISQMDFRSKDSIIDQLGELSLEAVTPKERAAILINIAELQRMKNEELKEEKKLVEFFIPMSCHKCPHYKKYGEPKDINN